MRKSKVNLMEYDEDELTLQKIYELADGERGFESKYYINKKIKPFDAKPHWIDVCYYLSGDGLFMGAFRMGKNEPEEFYWKKLVDLRRVSTMTTPVLKQKPQPWFWILVPPRCMEVVGEQFFEKRNPRHEAPIFPAFDIDFPYKEDKVRWEDAYAFTRRIKDKIYAYRLSKSNS